MEEEMIEETLMNSIGDFANTTEMHVDDDALSITTFATAVSDETEEFRGDGYIEFKLQKVSSMDFEKHTLSNPVILRKMAWRLMVYTSMTAQGKFLSVFLQANNGVCDKSDWSCRAYAEIKLVSSKENRPQQHVKRLEHIFYHASIDWGYKEFVSWSELENPENGFIDNDTVILMAYVKAEPPRGANWDSKTLTGFVGLKNQGATCYMNSLLQTLYFMRKFRWAVFKMPTECDINTTVALALQRVFYDLQFSKKSVGTKRLTKSFGWETQDSYRQHDVQEFLRVLLDTIENKMKGTNLEGVVPELIEGKTSSFVKCKDIDFTSITVETFYDIQLNIKDKSNIYESFSEYIATEELVGDNKYRATGHGLQDAVKGVIFVQFPPVLYLHLMRYQYDPVSDTSVKCNDRFEFYDEINLDNFLIEKEPTPTDYKLHAVLVHSGEQSSGHYVVFIDPNADGNWFKFDDDLVSSCSKTDAIDNNFGGLSEFLLENSTNAYMLVYVRKSEFSSVLREIEESDLPHEMVAKINELVISPIMNVTAVTVSVLLESDLESHTGFGLVSSSQKTIDFDFKKNDTMQNLIECLTKAFGVKELRFFKLICNEKCLYLSQKTNRLNVLVSDHADNDTGYWRLFVELEMPNNDYHSGLQSFDNEKQRYIFLKYYDARITKLYYLKTIIVNKITYIYNIIEEVIKEIGLSLDTDMLVFEELHATLTLVDPQLTVGDVCLNSNYAHILIFEINGSDADKYRVPSVDKLQEYLLNQTEICFIDKNMHDDDGFFVQLSKNDTYAKMEEILTKRLNIEMGTIRFYKNNSYMSSPLIPISTHTKIFEFLSTTNNSIIYFEILKTPINEDLIPSQSKFKSFYLSANLKQSKEINFYINNTLTISEILAEAYKLIEFDEGSTKKLRLSQVYLNALTTIPIADNSNKNLKTISSQLHMQGIYRIEEIPNDELELDSVEFLIPIAHFDTSIRKRFNTPFFAKAKEGEPYEDFTERIRIRLNISTNDWKSYAFWVITKDIIFDVREGKLINRNHFAYNELLDDGVLPYFGLDHSNNFSRGASRTRCSEKGVYIYT